MRTPFPPHQISKLPKPTKAQNDAVKADFKAGVRCEVCGGWHHPQVVHLDYVGHAALTDRLLDVDPGWLWEPVAFGPDGLPALDRIGGLWIKLTINGVTRLGYGDADGKQGGNAVKEAIGDALRNAAMRFGAALDLWHKGELHIDDPAPKPEPPAGTNWGGIYPTKTALRAARVAHHAELERMAVESTFDDLDGYLTSPEYQEYVRVAGLHFPNWLDGPLPDGAPPEYVQTFALEQKARDMIAIRGNIAAEQE
jgi:hypothetical protein